MKKKKREIPKTVKEAERTVAANPRYEGLKIAEATRRIMRSNQKKAVK